ncbi:hypothetical protein ACQUSR_02335 [Streptomyces sp. P1-3]
MPRTSRLSDLLAPAYPEAMGSGEQARPVHGQLVECEVYVEEGAEHEG